MIRTYQQLKAARGGFTVVELLIVIVVIGILATLTIISYSGVTNDANTVKAQSNAATVQKVIETMNANNGSYPTTISSINSNTTTTRIPSSITLASTALTSSNGTTNIRYECKVPVASTACAGTTGGRIQYYDFKAAGTAYIYVGDASSSGGTFSVPAS